MFLEEQGSKERLPCVVRENVWHLLMLSLREGEVVAALFVTTDDNDVVSPPDVYSPVHAARVRTIVHLRSPGSSSGRTRHRRRYTHAVPSRRRCLALWTNKPGIFGSVDPSVQEKALTKLLLLVHSWRRTRVHGSSEIFTSVVFSDTPHREHL